MHRNTEDAEHRRQENIKIAQKAIDYCRKIIPLNSSSTQPLITDKDAVRSLHDHVVKARAQKIELKHLVQNKKGFNALHLAVIIGNLKSVEAILNFDSGRNIINNQKDDGWTALHLAVTNGFVDIANELLKRGADPNITNNNGHTALDMAIFADQFEFAWKLVKAGAKYDLDDLRNLK